MGVATDSQLNRLRPGPTLLRRVAEVDEFKRR